MRPGQVVHMKSCTAVDGRNSATFGPPKDLPKGTTMAFVFLGNAKPGEWFDPEPAMKAIGWQRIVPLKTKAAPTEAVAAYFTKEGGIYYYEHPAYPVENVRGRGETKKAAFGHWQLLTKGWQP